MFFTVIVPVYNVETYLRECIDSILSQSFRNYELILVDDGSTDMSGEICDKFASIDNRVHVIHKRNGGLSDARNTGIAKAKGKYVLFVDSDDYIEAGTLDNFYGFLKDSDKDVLITRLKQFYEDVEYQYMDGNMPVELIQGGNKRDILSWIFEKSQNTWPAVRYIVKYHLIEKYNLKFTCGYLHEDINWTTQLFLYATTFTCSDFYWYNYRVRRKGSITTNMSANRTSDVIELVAKNIRDKNFFKLDEDLRKIIFKRLVSSLYSHLYCYKHMSKQDKLKIIDSLICNQSVLIYTKEFRHRIFLIVCRLFGFRFGLGLMGIIHR